ncbi:uncharacterized protein LOC106639650 [Copidosoma floridanum]|uniref:uncharacterized protein LOC106639650 n=1 Tax=Copidosoma floridanum TaxID=29053 RepID=UPI0006C9A3F7|nr:uncharacterized protein LOC106639650 [Copidosoma floridanum]
MVGRVTILLVCSVTLATYAAASGVTKNNRETIYLTDKDIVPKDELGPLLKEAKKEYRFIGDLVIGERHADETIFRRSIEAANPTDQVYSSAVTINVERGTIHYLSVTNEKNSYVVVCDEPYSLGTSRTSFNLRVPPNTKSQLWLLVAAH